MRTALLLSGFMLLLTSAANAAGDVAAGKDLAAQWCGSCHLVGDSGTAGDGAPPFVALAKDPGATTDRLSAFLTEPHGGMPELSLTRQEIDDLVAYIESLK